MSTAKLLVKVTSTLWLLYFMSSVENLVQSIIIMQPMTDLCWQCQKNSTVIVRSSNCSEEEKSSTIKIAEEHLRIVQMERSYYTSSWFVRSHYVTDNSFAPPQPAS